MRSGFKMLLGKADRRDHLDDIGVDRELILKLNLKL
jgi:hypothetical protein